MNIPSAPSDASPRDKIENPWLRAFLAQPWTEFVLGQVLICRRQHGFELRHVDDRGAASLKSMRPSDARQFANFTATGEYRPLKSAPTLKKGWVLVANSPDELETALNYLYPNALADRFARGPVTDYRPFTARQTGMYRITTFLKDDDVAHVIERTCNPNCCLKQRLWSVGTSPADRAESKSQIPCLEPCAIFLEDARKEVRALQENERRAAN